MSNLNKCKLIDFKNLNFNDGSILTFADEHNGIDFSLKRIYFITNLNNKSLRRGFHAHKNLHQILVPISGSFEIELTDGNNKKIFNLNKKNIGLRIHPLIWREFYNFSNNTNIIVLASLNYSEEDYIRNYNDFLKYIENES